MNLSTKMWRAKIVELFTTLAKNFQEVIKECSIILQHSVNTSRGWLNHQGSVNSFHTSCSGILYHCSEDTTSLSILDRYLISNLTLSSFLWRWLRFLGHDSGHCSTKETRSSAQLFCELLHARSLSIVAGKNSAQRVRHLSAKGPAPPGFGRAGLAAGWDALNNCFRSAAGSNCRVVRSQNSKRAWRMASSYSERTTYKLAAAPTGTGARQVIRSHHARQLL